jgi:hypothetical protein
MGQDFTHFADNVPQDIRQALFDFAEYAKGELDTYKRCEAIGEAAVDEIHGKHITGFIPFQDGGYSTSLLIRFDSDPSYSISQGMKDAADKMQADAYEQALSELGLPDNTPWDELTDEQSNKAFEIEQEYFDGALLMLECWQGRPERDEDTGKVFLRLSVNYSDAPYFRSKYAEDLHELELTPDALLQAVKTWPDDWQARLWRQLTTQTKKGE